MSKHKPVFVSAVANTLLKLGRKANEPITNLKMQKLLYFANGFCYAALDCLLFEEEMQAWQYGPVVPEIYYEFKHFGREPIEGYATFWTPEMDSGPSEIFLTTQHGELFDIVRMVFDCFGYRTSTGLVSASHEAGPWKRYYNDGKRDVKITLNPEDKKFFAELINEFLDSFDDNSGIAGVVSDS